MYPVCQSGSSLKSSATGTWTSSAPGAISPIFFLASPVRVTLRGHFLAAGLVHELADTGRLHVCRRYDSIARVHRLYLKADCTPRSTFLPVSERLTLVRNSQLQCHESLETGDWHLTRIKILRRVFDVPSLLQDLPYNM